MVIAAKYLLVFVAGVLVGRRFKLQLGTSFMLALVVPLVAAASSALAAAVLSFGAQVLLLSCIYACASMFASSVACMPLGGPRGEQKRPEQNLRTVVVVSVGILLGIMLGIVGINLEVLIDPLLILLVFAAGIDVGRVGVPKLGLGELLTPLASAASSVIIGLVLWQVTGLTPAIAAGMGWYTFTGPYLMTLGDYMGASVGFISNVLREQMTILLVPMLARRVRLYPAIALGGVTTMDTTLPVYTIAYGSKGAIAAVANGAVLTILVPTIVPVLAALCPSTPLSK